jgi:hypothetical protein
MSLNIESQAIKPRGINLREKFAFLVNWYSETSRKVEPHPNDPTQTALIGKMKDWAPHAKIMLEQPDEALLCWINNEIERAKLFSGYFEQYLVIELGRVIENAD